MILIKEMPVDQTKIFFHQTLVSMSETYFNATQDEKMTLMIILQKNTKNPQIKQIDLLISSM